MSTTAPANAPRFALAPDDRTAVIDTQSATGTPGLMKVLCRALVEEDAEFVARATSAHEQLVTALQAADNKLQTMLRYHSGQAAAAIEGLRKQIATALAAAGAA
jgi:hypothetical protein